MTETGEIVAAFGQVKTSITLPFHICVVEIEVNEHGCGHCGSEDKTIVCYSIDKRSTLIISADIHCEFVSIKWLAKGDR